MSASETLSPVWLESEKSGAVALACNAGVRVDRQPTRNKAIHSKRRITKRRPVNPATSSLPPKSLAKDLNP